MISNLWNNLTFWQTLFITVVVSLIIIKILTFLEKKVGVFKKYQTHDLDIYKKTSDFFSEEEITSFLDELEKNNYCSKATFQQVHDFKSLFSDQEYKYKSEILRSKIDIIISSLDDLESFIVNNFSEEGSLLKLSEKSSNNDLYSTNSSDKKSSLLELIFQIKNDYSSYRTIIKSYLHV